MSNLYVNVGLDKANKAAKFLAKDKVNSSLEYPVHITNQADLDWCETDKCDNPEHMIEYFTERLGTGEVSFRGADDETILDYVDVLVRLNEAFEVSYVNSGAICKDEHYLSISQANAITDSGKLLALDDETDWETSRDLKRLKRLLQNSDKLECSSEVVFSKDITTAAEQSFFTNNKNYYPTPPELIRRMLDEIDYSRTINKVLEPQAGKGDIIEYMKNSMMIKKARRRSLGFNTYTEFEYNPFEGGKISINAIEIDPELQANLRGKGITLIDSDFLSYVGSDFFDLIVMNPPFENGEAHLHKAIDIIFNGQIVCLLNAKTLKNPYSNERKRLNKRLTELGADIEYIKGAFDSAQRETEVEIALVYINVEQSVEADVFGKMDEESSDFNEKIDDHYEIEGLSKIKNLVIEYNRSRELVIGQIVSFYKAHKHTSAYLTLSIKDMDEESEKGTLTELMTSKVSVLNKKIKAEYWCKAMELDEIKSRMTSTYRKKIDGNLATMCSMEFTEANVRQFIINLINEYPSMIQGAIKNLFKEFTQHAVGDTSRFGQDYINNIHYFSGWKTNNAYKINKKVIMPFYRDDYDWKYDRGLDWNKKDFLYDMDKVISYFEPGNGGSLVDDIDASLESKINTKIDTEYFVVSVYKKGTIHFLFKDLDILRRFNIEACKGEGTLPHDYSTRPYDDMTTEEQDVVKSFESVDAYTLLDNTLKIGVNPLSAKYQLSAPGVASDEEPVPEEEVVDSAEELIIDSAAEVAVEPVPEEVVVSAEESANNKDYSNELVEAHADGKLF